MALADQERWVEAIEAAKKVVELNPGEQLGYTNVSRIYQRSGNVPEAEAWAAKARVLDWKQQLKEGKPHCQHEILVAFSSREVGGDGPQACPDLLWSKVLPK